MTDDEKRNQMTARNAALCAYYVEGHTLQACASRFRLSRQRAFQIVKDGGVNRPYVQSGRTKFLGVTVREKTKEGLRRKADEQGVSVSKLASDALDAVVAK